MIKFQAVFVVSFYFVEKHVRVWISVYTFRVRVLYTHIHIHALLGRKLEGIGHRKIDRVDC